MERICKNCNHWEQGVQKAPRPDLYGECNELSHHQLDPEYVLPVLDNNANSGTSNYELITGANFGCNHFAQA